jgi:geranylgeranyl diphosphate synthase type II
MSGSALSKLVEGTLREYGSLTRKAMRPYLGNREPRHFLYDIANDYPSRGGKMMRPSLCIAAARALGAPVDHALPTAVAIELLHNGLLIHDDIEDESELRRGRPSLNAMHGIPLALNAGDLLIASSIRPLLDNHAVLSPGVARQIIEDALRMAQESAEGQAIEIGWRQSDSATPDAADYLKMVLKKTCWLAAIFPLRAGTMIATGSAVRLEPFVRLGFFLGAAFQIRDDLLNLAPGRTYGKEANGDLMEGKRTLVIIRLLHQADSAERERLVRVLSKPRVARTAVQIKWLRKLIDDYDCIEYAGTVAAELAGAALHEFSEIYRGIPSSRDRHFIEAMASWVIQRN